ncbi:MAG: hypothetical protein ACF8AM_22535 [Rhodopirellula sp. JB055]|uniref:hypothetical protein n=1 Tax=Rhodopirellula sp. JB055 TaxID=3342846 RepID=UPI00370AFA01
MNTWIGIPFLSAFMFVMGGILVGHLLWYRDRSRDVNAIKDAEKKYAKAKAAARSRKHHFLGLQTDISSLQTSRDELQAENEQLRQWLKDQKQLTHGAETELGHLRAEHSRFELAAQDA